MHANQLSLFGEDTAPASSLPGPPLAPEVDDLHIPVGFAAFTSPATPKESIRSEPSKQAEHQPLPKAKRKHKPKVKTEAKSDATRTAASSEDLAGPVPPPRRRGRPPLPRDETGAIIKSTPPDVPFNGYSNSATYLVDLYFSNDPEFMTRVYGLMKPSRSGRSIDHRDLARLVQIRKATEADSNLDNYECGLDGCVLLLDYWAEGKVNWPELAAHYTSEALQLSGSETVALDVLGVLSQATTEGKLVRLNSGKLQRELYISVDKILKAMGSHWNRKLQAHVFEADPAPLLEHLFETGLIVKPDKPDNFGAFFTPDKLAQPTVQLAGLEPGMRVLEPNAGAGALLLPAAEIVGIENCVAVELQPHLADDLKSRGFKVYQADFLSQRHWGPNMLFDRVLMNPPFAGQADIDHVLHAWSMLARCGRLVAIMSAGVLFRQNKKTMQFRDLVASVGGTIEPNPPGSFKESGTSVHTVTVVMQKPDVFN